MKLLPRLLALAVLPILAASSRAQTVDTLVFGNTPSEQAHVLAAYFPTPTDTTKVPWINEPIPSDPSATAPSDVISGGMGLSARRLLPRTPNADIYGGQISFTMKVDPVKQNYISFKMWGSDASGCALLLNVNGREVGNRHGGGGIGEDPLYFYGGGWFANRFFYRTEPIPLFMSRGQTQVTITVRSLGYMYFYAAPFTYVNSYQNLVKSPSLPLYTAYTHTNAIPDVTGETQGVAPVVPTPRALETEAAVIANIKTSVNNLLATRLNAAPSTLDQTEAADLARIYDAKTNAGESWITYPSGKTDTDLANQIIAGLDNSTSAFSLDASQANGWGGGFAAFGQAIVNAWPLLSGSLDTTVAYGGTIGTTTRRAAWAIALRASIDNGRYYRRTIANQEIAAGWNIYQANRGLLLVDSTKALLEEESKRYFKEGSGILPYIGNDLRTGGSDGLGGGPVPTRNTNPPYGPNWYLGTSYGTTKDGNGFVGSDYGELASWVYKMGLFSGDASIQQRGIQMGRARLGFRYPGVDGNGYAIMMGTDPVGVRNNNLPGHTAYLGNGNGDDLLMASQGPAAVGADIVGAYQQMMNDGQALRTLYAQDPYAPGRWAAMKALAQTGVNLPAADGSPDFATVDSENMVVAAKHGEERFYANLFWRQPDFVNGLVKVFQLTPGTARLADVMADDVRFRNTGKSWITGNSVDSFATPADNPRAAYGSQPMSVAWRDDLSAIPSNNRDGGRGTGYTFRYGHWLVGINASYNQNYTVKLPSNFTSGTDLVSGTVKTGTVVLAPKASVVFYLPDTADTLSLPARSLYLGTSPANGVISVNWSHASGATTYNLLRSTTPGTGYTTIATGLTDNKYLDTTVDPSGATTYYYVLVSVNAAGVSGNSPEASATPAVPKTAGLPSPWVNYDVGISTAGTASISGGTYTVTSSPGVFGGASEGFHYLYQPFSGDGTVTVRLQGQTGTSGNARAGISIRTNLGQNATMASMNMRKSGWLDFNYCGADNGNIGGTSYSTAVSPPYWVRLVRTGVVITGYVSSDGVTWARVGAYTFGSLPYTCYVGLFSCAGTTTAGQNNIATFTNVTFPLGATAVPAAPTGLTVSPAILSSVLSWNSVDGAATYTLSRATNVNGPYTTIATGLYETAYTDYGLVTGTTYYYRVTAVNSAGSGASSATATLPLLFRPDAPTGLTANTTSGQVALDWDASSGASSYTVTRAIGGALPVVLASGLTTTAYTDTTAANGTSYTYGVYAVNSSGSSAQGAGISAMPPGYNGTNVTTQDIGSGKPGAASYLNGTYTLQGAGYITGVTQDSFRYAFESVTGDFVATTRVTSISNNSGGSDSAGLMIRQSTDESSSYYYVVMHPGYSVNGQLRSTQNGGTNYQGSTNGLTLPYWIRLQRAGNFMTAYRSPDGIVWTNIGSTTIAMTPTVLVGMTVSSSNASIYSSATFDNYAVTTSSATGGAATASTQSTGGEADKAFDGSSATKWYNNQLGGTGWLRYQFAASATKVVTRYEITSANDVQQRDPRDWQFQGSNDGTNWTTLDTRTGQVFAARYQTNTYTCANTTAYAYYRLNITANSGGSTYGLQLSELALIQAATTTGVIPPQPAAPSAAWSPARVDLSWPVAVRADSYNLKYSTTPGGPYQLLATGLTATAYSHTGLTNGTAYYYVLSAVNSAGESLDSPETTATPYAPPAAPTGLAAVSGNAQAILSWNASASASSYTVKRSSASGGPYDIIGTTTSTSYRDPGLVNGTAYYYIVTAVNLAAESSSSAQTTVTPLAPPPLGPLPGGYQSSDIGSVGSTGSSSYSAGTYSLNGSGGDIWGTSDGFQFANQTVTGDVTLIVKIASQSTTSPGKSGLMIRETLAANSKHVDIVIQRTSGAKMEYRSTTGGSSGGAGSSGGKAAPYWLKLVRAGNVFTGYIAPDNAGAPSTWTQLGTVTNAMNATLQVGLVQSAVNNTVLSTGTFTNFSVVAVPSPWASSDIGSIGLAAGSAIGFNGTFNVTGSGADIFGTSDAFRYAYQTATGDCDITARVTGVQNTNASAKAGVMIRESTAANSRHAMVAVSSGTGLAFQWRATTGGTTGNIGVGSIAAPYWVRLVRAGDVFTAYHSPDGLTWTTAGTVTIPMTTNVLIGLPVTSHNDGVLSTATLDNLTVTP